MCADIYIHSFFLFMNITFLVKEWKLLRPLVTKDFQFNMKTTEIGDTIDHFSVRKMSFRKVPIIKLLMSKTHGKKKKRFLKGTF